MLIPVALCNKIVALCNKLEMYGSWRSKPTNKYHYQKGLMRDFFKENYYINKFAKINGGFLPMFVLFLFRVVCMSFNYLIRTPPVVLPSLGGATPKHRYWLDVR